MQDSEACTNVWTPVESLDLGSPGSQGCLQCRDLSVHQWGTSVNDTLYVTVVLFCNCVSTFVENCWRGEMCEGSETHAHSC